MSEIRELLELAALATGRIAADGWEYFDYYADNVRMRLVRDGRVLQNWSPLHDDGDCARMEAQLKIDVGWFVDRVGAREDVTTIKAVEKYADHAGDRNAARRMASLRVAAKMGERMKEATALLGHADAKTTRRHYMRGPIKSEPAK